MTKRKSPSIKTYRTWRRMGRDGMMKYINGTSYKGMYKSNTRKMNGRRSYKIILETNRG